MPAGKPETGIIIVGAGIVGLLTAWELSKAGKSVTVLDKGEAGKESSWAAAGVLSPLGPWRYPEELQELARKSQAIYPELCEKLHAVSGKDPEYLRSGLLTLLEDEEEAEAKAWAHSQQLDEGLLTDAQISEAFPQLSTNCTGLLMNDVAQLRSPRFLQALLSALDKQGVEVLSNTAVRRLSVEQGTAQGVETADGVINAGTIVLAAGAWTPEIIPYGYWRPAIRPVKGQMLLYRGAPDLLDTMILQGSRYLVPRKDGGILAGSSMEEDGFNKSPTVEVKAELREFAEVLLPALRECEIEAHWTGLRPGSPDGVPLAGPHPQLGNLWLNCGHFRNGIATAPATAISLAEQVLSQY